MGERVAVQIGFLLADKVYQVNILFRKRKTLKIQVEAPDKITVFAPHGGRVEAIKGILEKNSAWILEQLEEVAQELPKKVFIDGEQFMYLGIDVPLKIELKSESKVIEVDYVNDEIKLVTPDSNGEIVREALIMWYRQQAKIEVNKRLPYFAKLIGEYPNRVVIKEQKTRWGSCSSLRNLNFNWRIVMAPDDVIDYVIIHELCHLTHMNHSRDYWNLVGSIMPDYKDKIAWLKVNGRQFYW